MTTRRAAGILLHPTSFPGRFGIGDLGAGATAFLTWAAAAGQSVWPTLPLGPTNSFNSPYGCPSAFAGNPLLIAPEELLEDGLLPTSALKDPPPFTDSHVDFGVVVPWKESLLRRSWQHFRRHAPPLVRDEVEAFAGEPAQAPWLDDWTLFSALKAHHGGQEWQRWDLELRERRPAALESARRELADDVAWHVFVQFLFFRQWDRVQGGGARAGNPDPRRHPDLRLSRQRRRLGPPGALQAGRVGRARCASRASRPTTSARPASSGATRSTAGTASSAEGFDWWIERLRANASPDGPRPPRSLPRLRGLLGGAGRGARRPSTGAGSEGPDGGSSTPSRAALGELPIVAEDLGVITPDVVELRTSLRPSRDEGAAVRLRRERLRAPAAPPRPECVVYTGTHDNDTTRGLVGEGPTMRRATAPGPTSAATGPTRSGSSSGRLYASRGRAWRSSSCRTSSASGARRG